MSYSTLSMTFMKAHKVSDEWKTDIDGQYTVNEQRNALYDSQVQKWVLETSKNPTDMSTLRTFFNTCKGQLTAFYWKYDSAIYESGDDVIYLVRFDSDKLERSVNRLGYSVLTVPIVTTAG